MKTNQKLIESQLRYSQLFPGFIQKSQGTKLRILEAAIECYVGVGVENTTYDRLAKLAKVTRPLVIRYFPDREELFKLVVRYIRENLLLMAVQAMEKQKEPALILKAYVQSTFHWLEKYPKHAKVWLLFYYYCGIRSELLEINSELVDQGHDRIAALIELGNKQGSFKCKDSRLSAKSIQNLITGSLLSRLTEKNMSSLVTASHISEKCLKLLRE